jgi:uncharacterized protein
MTIFELIDAGDADGVRALLEQDPAAAAARDEQGLSALMRAFYRGGEVLEAIRAAEPPLDPWDRLLVGESTGLPAPDAWSPDGFTPLHIAAFAHNDAAARALLAAGADPNVLATASFATVTPLGTAATFGAVEVALTLLEHGADTEATADHGFTPLQSAAANGSRELVELLLAHGARTDARNERGDSAADLAKTDDLKELLS